ncbi:MAG: universal stress protein [Gammaproteobacteria bacterium]|jgi:nucleotide-binding universal stress UspA family protein
MIEEIPADEPGIGAFKASGKLTDADYEQFVPRLEALIQEYGKISIFLELEEFHGWEPKAAWDDFKLGLAHQDGFERIAIVGDQDWEHWIALLAKPFIHARVRYFDYKDPVAAWDWLKQNALSAAHAQQSSFTPYEHVLIAIDFSTHAAQVLKRGLAIASGNDSRVTLVHVVEEPVFENEYDDVVLPVVSEHTVRQVERARTRLVRLAESMGAVKAECVALAGHPKLEINRYAEQKDIDLIITGSHGHSGVGAILGSTAGSLLHQAPCDVVVIRVME